MKTLNTHIKILLLFFALVASTVATTQNIISKIIFVRIYNLQGKKINKGQIIFINDSLIGLKENGKKNEVNFQDIGFIKTKRSVGNNVLIGAASGAMLGGVMGVATADPNDWVFAYSKGEGAAVFGSIGALGGAAIGSLTSLFKKSETYIISGSEVNWHSFQKIIGAQE